jgi:membrane associated rhomboid family serine protease
MIAIFRVKLSTVWYLGLWVGLQVLMVYLEASGVAWFAHIGGFVFGVLYALAIRRGVQRSVVTPTEV